MIDSEFMALVHAANVRFNALTADQQREHRRVQRKSWVIGEFMLEHPEMTREEAEKIYADLGY